MGISTPSSRHPLLIVSYSWAGYEGSCVTYTCWGLHSELSNPTQKSICGAMKQFAIRWRQCRATSRQPSYKMIYLHYRSDVELWIDNPWTMKSMMKSNHPIFRNQWIPFILLLVSSPASVFLLRPTKKKMGSRCTMKSILKSWKVFHNMKLSTNYTFYCVMCISLCE